MTVMSLLGNGFVGIGTTAPTTKLQITGGDIYIDDSTRGVILKSPNGLCARGTIDNTNTLLFTAITCP